MAGLVPVTRQPDTLQGFQLTSYADMASALNYLVGGGYAGNINQGSNTGTAAWQMFINHPKYGTSQIASVGDWIVIKNNATAQVVSAADFPKLYATA